MQTTGNAGSSQGFLAGVLFAGSHQAGHLCLGNSNFLLAPFGLAHIGNLEITAVNHFIAHYWLLFNAGGVF